MLHDFLTTHRENILKLCREKIKESADSKPTSSELERGLPVFYDEMIEVLRRIATHPSANQVNQAPLTNEITSGTAASHGKESLRLGYTINQVVQGYGSICQAITQMAHREGLTITPLEYRYFNQCLDVAIAEAVSEFYREHTMNLTQEENERLGFLAHELRNALSSASVAFEMIRDGVASATGSTSQVLNRALERMRWLIDQSLSAVRLQGQAMVKKSVFNAAEIISEVEATARIEAASRGIVLWVDIEPNLLIDVDRQLLISALANLVQNGLKYSRPGGRVCLMGREENSRVLLQIKDECGGIENDVAKDLFKPFTQKNKDKSGLGLGLTLTKQAVSLNNGDISVHNLPGKGCIFTISLPKAPLRNSTVLYESDQIESRH